MIFQTDKGERIQADGQPEWNEFHSLWYVSGFRFIKSRQAFSKTRLLHKRQGNETGGRHLGQRKPARASAAAARQPGACRAPDARACRGLRGVVPNACFPPVLSTPLFFQ
jgi:hypothetical protein